MKLHECFSCELLCPQFTEVEPKAYSEGYEIARNLGITQKSAWFLDHRIRPAMQEGTSEKIADEVEVGPIAGVRVCKSSVKGGNKLDLKHWSPLYPTICVWSSTSYQTPWEYIKLL